MNFHIITLFPGAFESYIGESIIKRAIEDKKIKIKFYNPRDFTKDKFARVDRPPFGGGPGMVIQAEPVICAIDAALKGIKNQKSRIKKNSSSSDAFPHSKIIWLSPGGKLFTNEYAGKSAKKCTDIIIVCGRYEGIDARVKKVFKMDDISIGPFVLTGGEIPAMLIIDCVARQVQGVLGNFDSLEESRISSHNVYTRPEIFEYNGKKYKAPKVLLSGNPKLIDEWKQSQSQPK